MPAHDPTSLYLARLGTDHSRATVRSALTTLARRLGATDPWSVDWASLTVGDLVSVHAGLSSYSPAWSNTLVSVLRQWVRLAGLCGLVDGSLVDAMETLPRFRGGGGRSGRDLAACEIDRLRHAAAGSGIAARRDQALVGLLAGGALRRSEVAGLEVDDWDPARSILTVRGKGRRVRVVPLSGSVAASLNTWLAEHPGRGRILRSVDRWGRIGAGMSPRAVRDVIARLSVTAGIDPVSPHAFRAHRITEVIAASDVMMAMQLAGHADLRTTASYDRRGIEALRAVLERVDDEARVVPLRAVG